jgi:hypothetical protein
MSDVVTSTQLNQQILEVGRQLQSALTRSDEASAEYVRIKHDYKTAWGRAYLRAKSNGCTEQMAKSTADIETEEQGRLHDLALEHKRNARLVVETYRDLISARQTIAANTRAEMRSL